MAIGYYFPKKYYLISAFIFGTLWELFEYYYGEKRPGWLGGDCKKLNSDKNDDGKWWYGKWSDILMNAVGLYCGYYLQKFYT